MECPQCGHEVGGRALFCPNCGQRLDSPAEASGSSAAPLNAASEAQEGKGCRRSVLVIVVAIVVVLAIVGLGAAGIYFGLRDRSQTERQVAEEHYAKGLTYLAEEQYELAQAEFELVLQLQPDHENAQIKLSETQGHLQVLPTATPVLQKETAAVFYADVEAAYAAQDWEAVLQAADKLIAHDPDYRRGEVDGMLFQVFVAQAQDMLAEGRLEEAIRLYDRALLLQPDNATAQHARNLAAGYVEATAYVNADWAQAAEAFKTLYEIDPDYRDVRQRLVGSYVALGDQATDEERWCDAAEAYTASLAIEQDEDIRERNQAAMEACKQAPTPTPEPGEPTPGVTVGPQVPSGSFSGRLVERTGIDSGKMYVRGKVLDKNGNGIQGTQVKIQAWDWSAIAVTDGNGQYSFDGLSNPVTYTLSLVTLSSYPFDVEGQWGKISWVDFTEAK